MAESQKKQQDFMVQTQQLTLERQLQMQNAMRERLMAFQIARQRELLLWTGSFFGIVSTGLVLGATARGKPALLGPLLPISFIVGYQYDMAYGTKMSRIRQMADDIMEKEAGWLALPHGNPTFAEIESRRNAGK